MRKLLLMTLLLASACKSHTVEMPANAPSPAMSAGTSAAGAASPRLALETFLAAVRAQDLQAMSSVWGVVQFVAQRANGFGSMRLRRSHVSGPGR